MYPVAVVKFCIETTLFQKFFVVSALYDMFELQHKWTAASEESSSFYHTTF